jgi:hypothetical protein
MRLTTRLQSPFLWVSRVLPYGRRSPHPSAMRRPAPIDGLARGSRGQIRAFAADRMKRIGEPVAQRVRRGAIVVS